MSKLPSLWPEISAVGIAVFTYVLSDLWYVAFIVAVSLIILIRGHTHVEDNSQRSLFVLGNYLECVGPGHHFAFWPFAMWGHTVDTRYALTECHVVNASSSDRASFKVTIQFSYRFQPNQIKDPQLAQELISNGVNGRAIAAQTAAQSAALYITRGQSHRQLFMGTQQALIQGQIAQETAKRLATIGMEIHTSSFRATFIGPKEIEIAFTQEHAGRPIAQREITYMNQFLDALKSHTTPEVQQFIDLFMVKQVGNHNVDPLSALVAQEWFRHSRNHPGGTP